ncbi:hypothetical protein M569_06066 [Genlisea aurea]|uniref:Uncharacterized protein n=1 Tax=Genlisea aurea TaxID=192259 RepID=S8DZC8_9LAMI|nr:hypothetical protein M569_06066 [Genlisea aurea]
MKKISPEVAAYLNKNCPQYDGLSDFEFMVIQACALVHLENEENDVISGDLKPSQNRLRGGGAAESTHNSRRDDEHQIASDEALARALNEQLNMGGGDDHVVGGSNLERERYDEASSSSSYEPPGQSVFGEMGAMVSELMSIFGQTDSVTFGERFNVNNRGLTPETLSQLTSFVYKGRSSSDPNKEPEE